MFTPSLQFFGLICKRQEPVRIRTFSPEPAIEGFNEGKVAGLAGVAGIILHDSSRGSGADSRSEGLLRRVDTERWQDRQLHITKGSTVSNDPSFEESKTLDLPEKSGDVDINWKSTWGMSGRLRLVPEIR